MRLNVSFKYLKKSRFIDNVLGKDIKKLERRLKIFHRDDPIHVSVHLEKNPNREEYFCRAHVYVPNKVINSQEKGGSFSLAINKSFSALFKQLDKIKHRTGRRFRKRLDKSSE